MIQDLDRLCAVFVFGPALCNRAGVKLHPGRVWLSARRRKVWRNTKRVFHD